VDVLKRTLGKIDGGRVLDVATQEGGFVQLLMEYLKSYREIVGIDISELAIETARSTIEEEGVQFLVMDAEQLDFEDENFDTVSISASLHHLMNIPRVLNEMKRVLKPAGHFILAEMHRDGQTEAELTSIYLHHWIAEVDSALGRSHNSTLAREEFTDYIASLGLSNVEFYDYLDKYTEPFEEGRIARLESVIDRIIQRAEGANNYSELKERGEDLRQRLHAVGAQQEPILIIIGEK
jgi:ubiquinone/menaquinone biosynthesis C-methylase UbiE